MQMSRSNDEEILIDCHVCNGNLEMVMVETRRV